MDFRNVEGSARYDALLAHAGGAVVGLDFDGTLAPIVDDPAVAAIHPAAAEVLPALARRVLRVAIITGRPARQVVELGGLDQVARDLGDAGRVSVQGQYGNQRWSSDARTFTSSHPPEGLVGFAAELPDALHAADAADALVEDKQIALAVHTRRLPDPGGSFDRLLPVLSDLARAHNLHVEPGRFVVEVRGSGAHKGTALREAAADAAAVLYIGDDLGDLDAFAAVADLRGKGLPGLLVCSGSREQAALVELSDLVVDGPAGVLEFLARVVADLG